MNITYFFKYFFKTMFICIKWWNKNITWHGCYICNLCMSWCWRHICRLLFFQVFFISYCFDMKIICGDSMLLTTSSRLSGRLIIISYTLYLIMIIRLFCDLYDESAFDHLVIDFIQMSFLKCIKWYKHCNNCRN